MPKTASNLYSQATALFAVTALVCLTACAEVPITHRRSLHLVPDSELLSLSYQQYSQVLHHSRLSAESAEVQMVRRVGAKGDAVSLLI